MNLLKQGLELMRTESKRDFDREIKGSRVGVRNPNNDNSSIPHRLEVNSFDLELLSVHEIAPPTDNIFRDFSMDQRDEYMPIHNEKARVCRAKS